MICMNILRLALATAWAVQTRFAVQVRVHVGRKTSSLHHFGGVEKRKPLPCAQAHLLSATERPFRIPVLDAPGDYCMVWVGPWSTMKHNDKHVSEDFLLLVTFLLV